MQPAALSLGVALSAAEQAPSDTSSVVMREEPWAKSIDGLVVIAARSPEGQVVVYPITHATGDVFVTPADISADVAHQIHMATLQIIKERDLLGVIAVTFDPITLEVLEIFMGPHRAGLWTIDGSSTSQFDQHLRALLNLPFGTPEMTAPLVVTQMVIGGEKPELLRPFLHLYARDPGLKVHLYGIPVESGVEIGHVTVVGSDLEDLKARAEHAAGYLNGRIEE